MEFKLNFSGRGHKYTQEEIELVAKVMQEADPLTQSKYKDEFEAKFRAYNNSPFAFSVINATAALELTAQLCQFKNGDELIAPAHTFTASVYPFIKNGAKIVWADIDIDTRVVTAAEFEKKITPKTKAILVVHLYGFVAEMKEILKIAEKHNILVIEDAAQAIGSSINGVKAGSFGDFGIFSFHSHKNITTLGEGGMLTVKDKKYAEIIPMLRHNGHTTFDFKQEKYWLPGMGDVDFPVLNGEKLWPNNYSLGEVECALGSKLLYRIDEMNSDRRKRAMILIDSLKEFPEISFHKENSERHNYHQLIATFKNGIRDNFMDKMAQEMKIKCILPYYPLYNNSLYKNLDIDNQKLPNTELFFNNMCSLPFQHWMSDDDFEYLIKSIKQVLIQIKNDKN